MDVVKTNLKTLLNFRNDYRGVLRQLVAKHGDKFLLKYYGFRMHIISDPRYIEYVLFTNYINYIRPANPIFDPLVNTSKLPPKEVQERWKKFRVTLLNKLMNDEGSKRHTAKLVQTIQTHLESWEKVADGSESFYIYPDLEKLTCKNLLATELGDIPLDVDRLVHLIDEISMLDLKYETSLTKLEWKFPTRTKQYAKKVMSEMIDIADSVINYSLSDEHPDMQVFKEAVKAYGLDYHSPDLKKNIELWAYLRSIAGGYLIAGFDTVSRSLANLFVYLSKFPDVADKVRDEVNRVVGDRDIIAKDLSSLVYTRAVFLEGLRYMGGVLPILVRQTLQSATFDNYNFKKNDKVLIPIFNMGFLKNYWTDPEKFEPSRFLNINIDDDRYRYVYLPFSAGIRSCSGKYFAINEAIIIIAMILRKYRLELLSDRVIDSDNPGPIVMRVKKI